MDCRLVNTQRPEQAKSKRIQRFIRFVLKPGDEELIGQLSTNQQAILAVKGSYEERGMQLASHAEPCEAGFIARDPPWFDCAKAERTDARPPYKE